MITRWEHGRTEVDALLAAGDLQRVPPNLELARAYLDQAQAHLALAQHGVDADAIGSFQLAYDAARKALTSLLLIQGLRPTSRGGHIAVQETVSAQFGAHMRDVIRDFAWMRRVRNDSKYPTLEHPVATADDALQAHACARDAIDVASKLVDQLPVY